MVRLQEDTIWAVDLGFYDAQKDRMYLWGQVRRVFCSCPLLDRVKPIFKVAFSG